MAVFISIIIILSLWSITKTLEKMTKRITGRQDEEIEHLQEIKKLLLEKKE
ncbi:hypothetical protein LC065_18160 [Halobacillus litoralis]|uniref:hypothetical protein n=1 Tax=Halobacillus litoralis TaxID=45668 RepID=UPI001CFE8B97|nr:hypothetical protein [Halobacillus litoralis]WLR47415.1 hypothetical protein LC065_18160 [Halobacillus litoralis]